MDANDWALAFGVGAARGAKAVARGVPGKQQQVIALNEAVARALSQVGQVPVRAQIADGRLALDDGIADALCATGLAQDAVSASVLRECARVVRDGGHVLLATAVGLVGRGPERHVLTALFMHAGLVDVRQHVARGTAITSGRVRR